MLEACLEEIRSNLEEESTEVTKVANTVFGRTTYIARQIVDLGILDVRKDRKILLLLTSILKKEGDLRQRAYVMFSQYVEFQAQMMAGYANPSFVSVLFDAAAHVMQKPSVQETFMEGYQKITSEQIELAYEQLKALYCLAVDELVNKYKLDSHGASAPPANHENAG